jgi:hypothetical protein
MSRVYLRAELREAMPGRPMSVSVLMIFTGDPLQRLAVFGGLGSGIGGSAKL